MIEGTFYTVEAPPAIMAHFLILSEDGHVLSSGKTSRATWPMIQQQPGAIEVDEQTHAALKNGGRYLDGAVAQAIPDATALGHRAISARNRMLAACDWTQVSDIPHTDATKAAWRAYRQALRDLPTQEGYPLTIAWPKAPEK